jgi:hypothetical protein
MTTEPPREPFQGLKPWKGLSKAVIPRSCDALYNSGKYYVKSSSFFPVPLFIVLLGLPRTRGGSQIFYRDVDNEALLKQKESKVKEWEFYVN